MPVAVIGELSVEKVQLPSYFLSTEYGEENVKTTAVPAALAACDKVKVVPLIAETVVPVAIPVPVTV